MQSCYNVYTAKGDTDLRGHVLCLENVYVYFWSYCLSEQLNIFDTLVIKNPQTPSHTVPDTHSVLNSNPPKLTITIEKTCLATNLHIQPLPIVQSPV